MLNNDEKGGLCLLCGYTWAPVESEARAGVSCAALVGDCGRRLDEANAGWGRAWRNLWRAQKEEQSARRELDEAQRAYEAALTPTPTVAHEPQGRNGL